MTLTDKTWLFGLTADQLLVIGTWFYAIAVTATLIYVIRQTKLLRRSIESSTYENLLNLFHDFAKALKDNPKAAKALLYEKGGDVVAKFQNTAPEQYAELSESDVELLWLSFLYLNWAESVVIQSRRLKSVPKDVWQHWETCIKQDLSTGVLAAVWDKNKHFYHPLLRSLMDANKPSKPSVG
jgi:hypothetical protein